MYHIVRCEGIIVICSSTRNPLAIYLMLGFVGIIISNPVRSACIVYYDFPAIFPR